MRESRSSSSSALTFMGMIMAVLAQASNMVVNKLALSGKGINKYCLILYTDVFSTLILLPSLFLLFRSKSPPLTPSVLFKIFLLALIVFISQYCGYTGIELSSPTLGSALMNIVPALTFALAVVFSFIVRSILVMNRMEKLDWRSSSSQAKIVGTVVSIAGAFIATLYKGEPIMFVPPARPQLDLSPQTKWALGGFLFAGEALMISMWFIVQAMILKDYPVLMIIAFFGHVFTTVIAALFSLVVVRDPQAWHLTFEKGLLSIVYTAIVSGVFRVVVAAWCLKRAGPLYVSLFKPIGIIFAVALGVIFLGDPLCIGSLIGAAVIVCGFYAVVWGKSREEIEKCSQYSQVGNNVAPEESHDSNHKIPLLA